MIVCKNIRIFCLFFIYFWRIDIYFKGGIVGKFLYLYIDFDFVFMFILVWWFLKSSLYKICFLRLVI